MNPATDAPTGLADFIRWDSQGILSEWDDFARALDSGRYLHVEVLRDHAAEILEAVIEDMGTLQSHTAQESKGKGLLLSPGSRIDNASSAHAVSRVIVQFSLPELVSEFRALRACVLRRWSVHHPSSHDLDQVHRFNEAIDEAVSASVNRFNSKLEASRAVILGVLAHDLRSPLQAISMSSLLMLRSATLDDKCVSSALMIQRSVKSMSQLIGDLLDYSRTRLGDELPLSVHKCDMTAVCGEAVEEMQAGHPLREIVCDFADDAMGEWDPARIKQVLANLLANALQHGDPQSAVRVALRTTPDWVAIAVHNRGTPIPSERQSSIFLPLYVTKDRRPGDVSVGSSGLGLGLYIARQIALGHGGEIGLASSIAEGTTFTVSLPRTWSGPTR